MKHFATLQLSFVILCVTLGAGTMAVFADPLTMLFLPEIGLLEVSNVQQESFDNLDAWELYSSPSGVLLGVEQGIYRAYAPNSGYVWGLNTSLHRDVVLDVEVTPLTIFTDNGAGVICRADTSNNGDGYYFMINAEGYYSIQIGAGDTISPLIDWTPSSAIRTGIDTNTIRAVCIGDMLALYINDQFVDGVQNSMFRSGFAGLAIAGGAYGVDMGFDDVSLYAVSRDI